jgi:uncharacterized protein YqgV (UPF0045/DUF77 family)
MMQYKGRLFGRVRGRLMPLPTKAEDVDELIDAARKLIKHWDTPMWKNEVSTALVVNRLRDALRKVEETDR